MFTQNQKVWFKIDDLEGEGKIVGKATTEMPVIGAMWIIEPINFIPNETYPYSHFVANETQLMIL